MRPRAATAAAVVAALLLGACAAPAGPGAMTLPAAASAALRPHAASVSVAVQGGSETGALDSSNIANGDLKAAIEASITQSRLFREVVQGRGGDCTLAVSVVQMSKPMFGGAFTVDLETAWSLTRAADGRVLLRQVVKSSGTATMSDALVGAARLRLAVENAARDAIAQGLAAISALDF